MNSTTSLPPAAADRDDLTIAEKQERKNVGPVPPMEDYVDGGWEGWLTVLGGWCSQITSIGQGNAFGVYEDFYKENYLSNESSSTIAWIGSVQLAMLFGMGLIAGPLFDKGHFRVLMISSSALYILCNFLLSITKPHQFYQIFLSQGIGMGLAMGLTYAPTFAVIGHHFQGRRRSVAMGLASTGSSIGGIIHPIMLNNLINRGGDAFGTGGTSSTFGRAIRINAGMNAALLVLATVLMREKKGVVAGGAGRGKVKPNIGGFLTEPKYLLVSLGCVLGSFGFFFPAVYVQLFSTTKGISPTFSFYTLSVLNAGSTFGRILPGLLADRFGSLNILLPATYGLGATTLGYLGVKSLAADAVVTAIFRFFSGGFISLMVPTVASLAKNPGEIGARIGITSAFCAISCLTGPPINGALLTGKFLWNRPIIFSGVCALSGGTSLLFARLWRTKSDIGSSPSPREKSVEDFEAQETFGGDTIPKLGADVPSHADLK
ncbi:MFS general substrate transporter [Sistotremastrum niveocremeum HHB9708]|uniref:MFS general substrate transporter n=1 Tax=Sistotremastrum niveocremeum HHB9708 TaxID=1314777 RepID=A0A164T5Y4_9AGAM|nr:MFS general substrate transporter [Sistotremastrum niveocremeum HHB9708]